MNLRQQIVQERIEKIANGLALPQDLSFIRFAHPLIVDQSMYAFDDADLVNGGQDKQIDVITIIQDDAEATVYLLQFKNAPSFSSNDLIQMRNGLGWVFQRSRQDIATLSNARFRDKILEYRSLQGGIGPANIQVIAGFVTNGISSSISDEFRQEMKIIVDEYDNGTFSGFSFQVWGCDELVARINALEKKERKIDADVRIKYDANNPSLIKYHAEGLKGLVCTAAALEIARVVNGDSTGSVFDSNIRRFLGTRGGVNSDILKTCATPDTSYLFWFLNNGITIVCDSFDAVTDPDCAHVKIKNMQIVNGCQTSATLALAEKNGQLAADTRVLLRIYEAANSELVERIVLTTNNQNRISNRDLRANDPVQLDMERAFAAYDYWYERKPRQYDDQTGLNAQRIIANEIVAQSYLAIVLKKPSDARRRKYKVWGELYEQIFGGQIIEPYVIAIQMYRYANSWMRQSGYTSDNNDLRRKLANNGVFHIARIAAYLWRGDDNWKIDRTKLKSQVLMLEKNSAFMDDHFEEAMSMLERIVQSKPNYATDIDGALKSNQLEDDIDRMLYKRN